MRIITRAVYGLFDRKILFVRTERMRGTVVYAKGDSGTQVVPTGPYEGQEPFVNQLFREAASLYRQGAPQYFPGSTVAATPDSLTNNQNSILNFVGSNAPVTEGAINTAVGSANNAGNNSLLQTGKALQNPLQDSLMALLSGNNPALAFGQQAAPDVGSALTSLLNPSTGGINTAGAPGSALTGVDASGEVAQSLQGGALNPFLDQVIQGATRSADRQFTDTVLPGIRSNAVAAGQRGGTREGIAQGIAGSRHDENVSDIISSLYSNAFNQGAAERGQALGIVGQDVLQTPGNQLETARLNEASAQGAGNRQLGAADLALRPLLSGSELASGNVATGAQQAGNLLGTGESQRITELFSALGLIPSLQSSGLAQLGAGNQIGLQQLGLGQAQRDDEVARFFYEQLAPYAALAQFQSFISGNYGSTV